MSEKKRELYAQEAERLQKSQERVGAKFWRPSVGKNVIRILPHWSKDPEKVFYKRVRIHFGVGPDKSRLVCRKNISPDEQCPVCDYVKRLYEGGHKDEIALARDISAKERFACNIVDVQNVEEGVQVWEMGRGLFNDILLLFLDGQYGDIDDLEKGRHLTVMRQGESKTETKYTVIPSVNVSRISPKVMEKVYDLDALYPVPTVQEMEAALTGSEPDEKEDEIKMDEDGDLIYEEEPKSSTQEIEKSKDDDFFIDEGELIDPAPPVRDVRAEKIRRIKENISK